MSVAEPACKIKYKKRFADSFLLFFYKKHFRRSAYRKKTLSLYIFLIIHNI